MTFSLRKVAAVSLAVYYLPDGCKEPRGIRTRETNPFRSAVLAAPGRMGRGGTRMGAPLELSSGALWLT